MNAVAIFALTVDTRKFGKRHILWAQQRLYVTGVGFGGGKKIESPAPSWAFRKLLVLREVAHVELKA